MLGGGRAAGYLGVDPAPAPLGLLELGDELAEHEALLRLRQLERPQSLQVRARPRGPALPAQPLPQQQLGYLVAAPHELLAALLAQPAQVAVGLLRGRRAEALDHVAHGEHARQEVGVAPVGLHAVAGGPEHLGDGADAGGKAQRVERALEVEAGRAALVDGARGLGQGPRPPRYRRRVVAERGAHHLARLVDERRGADGPCVHVETDAGRVDHGWDLP